MEHQPTTVPFTTAVPTPEILSYPPEQQPQPETSPDPVENLDYLLARVMDELALIINKNQHTIEAAAIMHGMIEQTTDVLGRWYILESGNVANGTEVVS